MTPEEIKTYRKESTQNVAMVMQESDEQKFRDYIEKPTLMEALLQTQAQISDLEIRIEHVETYLKQYHGGHVKRMVTLDEQIEDHEDRIRTMERMVQ